MRVKKFVEINCGFCKKKTLKEVKEYKRQTKKGRVIFYCNLICAAKSNTALMEKAQYNKDHPTEFNQKFKNYPRKIKDHPNPFKYYIRKIKARLKSKLSKKSINLDFNLTDLQLQKIWEKQKGICPYTQVKMCLPLMSINAKPHQASLDRIDSNKGYIENNVEFVCLSVNYAKNGFTKEQMLDFFSKSNIIKI